jgi:hypothetical protein
MAASLTPRSTSPSRRRTTAAAAWALSAAILLAGCSKAEQRATDATPSASTVSASASSGGSASSGSASAPTPTLPTSFAGTCADLVPISAVEDALGRPVVGQTAYVVGVREPNIGRVAYLNCRYGISTAVVKGKKVTATKVEIGISLYSTAKQAASRVAQTVDSYRSSGATQSAAQVGSYPATVLIGSGNPTLVVAAGNQTVAVTAIGALLGLNPAKALAGLGLAVLNATKPNAAPDSSTSDGESASASPSGS